MAAIIITLILNLLVGTPDEKQKDTTKDSNTTGTETLKITGGTGAWTNVDK